jgi:flagellar hook-associated protein 1 FlgK
VNNRTLAQYTLTIPAGATSFNGLINTLNASSLAQYASFSLDGNGALKVTPTANNAGLQVNVVSDSTARGASQQSFSRFFGLGDHYQADAATSLAVVPNIENNPSQMALATFNQSAAIGQSALTAGDQTGITALEGLQNSNQSFSAAGGLASFNGTLTQYGAAFLSNAGLMSATANGREQDTNALKTELTKRQNDVSGVNLDEELSNMILYQNSYNASAKVISTVQTLYDSLLAIVH